MIKKLMAFLLMSVVALYTASAMAMKLPLPMVQQQQTNWCWAGSTQAIENALGRTANQCGMANYLQTRLYGYIADDCCRYTPLSLPNTNPPLICNQGNYLLTSERVGSVQEMMSNNYSTPNVGLASYISLSSVQTEVNAGRPFMMRWDWSLGGAHALVGYGASGNMVNYMDPWPWNPQGNTSTYSYVVSGSDHAWTQTIKPTIAIQPPVPDIKANGVDTTLYVSGTTPVNVTVSLNPGGYTNTDADVWVVANFQGILYYYHYNPYTAAWEWTTQAVPSAQGALAGLSSTNIWSGTVPAGYSITFYFAVDFSMNGLFDEPYYGDYVTITGY